MTEEEIQKMRAALIVARMALQDCSALFSAIRNDWSDPRTECREGWDTVDTAVAVIDAVLPPSAAHGESKESK